MSRYYIDITGIPDSFLEFMGYCKLKEDDEFELRSFKGDAHILHKKGRKYLYVEDANDAAISKRDQRWPRPRRHRPESRSQPPRKNASPANSGDAGNSPS